MPYHLPGRASRAKSICSGTADAHRHRIVARLRRRALLGSLTCYRPACLILVARVDCYCSVLCASRNAWRRPYSSLHVDPATS